MAKRIQVGGRIESKEVGGIVTGAAEILDDAKEKKQSVINQETDDELVRLDQSKQDNLTFDNAPTEGSDNPVKSGGVYAADKALSDAIEAILLLIPSAASALNKLVDTAMMNSSISTATATFRGTYNVVTDLSLTVDATHEQIAAALGNAISTADNNDYAFVQVPVSAESTDIRRTERYKFNGTEWGYEYDLNTSGFTAAQWAAINSGITIALVGKLIGLPTSSELQALLGQKQDTLTFDNLPTAGSANPVKSGGVYSAINDEKTAREQLANTVTGIDGRVGNVEEVIPTGAAANNKLVANNSMEAYVTSIIEAITASFTIATVDGHINLTLTQTNGRVASLTLTSSDIASAQALTALTGRVSTAEGNITTLGGRVSTNETDIANLQQLYNNLQQSKPVPVTALPETGQQQGVIYRLAGTTSYSDYMWNGSTWVLMATYNNAIDNVPTAGSDNLVKSGGVYEEFNVQDSQNPLFGNIGNNGIISNVNFCLHIDYVDVSDSGIVTMHSDPLTINGVVYSPRYRYAFYDNNKECLYAYTNSDLTNPDVTVIAGTKYMIFSVMYFDGNGNQYRDDLTLYMNSANLSLKHFISIEHLNTICEAAKEEIDKIDNELNTIYPFVRLGGMRSGTGEFVYNINYDLGTDQYLPAQASANIVLHADNITYEGITYLAKYRVYWYDKDYVTIGGIDETNGVLTLPDNAQICYIRFIAIYYNGSAQLDSDLTDYCKQGMLSVQADFDIKSKYEAEVDKKASSALEDIYNINQTIYPSGERNYYGKKVDINLSSSVYKCNRNVVYEVQIADNPEREFYATNESIAIYNGLVFCFSGSSIAICKVYDLESGAFIGNIATPSGIPTAIHANSAQFSNVFLDANDEFPLLLLANGSYSYEAYTMVLRIQRDSNNNFTATLHKLIYYQWSQKLSTFIGSQCIDMRRGLLWLIGYYGDGQTTPDYNRTDMNAFVLPNLLSPETVTLTDSDIVNSLYFPYRVGLQDSVIFNGFMYICALDQGKFEAFVQSYPERCILVIDLESGGIESKIPCGAINGGDMECDGIDIYNRTLYYQESGADGGIEYWRLLTMTFD